MLNVKKYDVIEYIKKYDLDLRKRKCKVSSTLLKSFNNFKAQISFTTTEVDSLILYVECCCLSLTNFLDAVITSLVTVGALNAHR